MFDADKALTSIEDDLDQLIQKTSGDAPEYPSKTILDALDRNEDGDAHLFIEQHRGRFCYDAASRRWYTWAGHYWIKDAVNEVMKGVDDVIEIYRQEAQRRSWCKLSAEKSGEREASKKQEKLEQELIKRIRLLQSVQRKENVLILARTGANSLAIRGDEWDRDPWLFGCRNGIIDLRTVVSG